MLRDKKEYNIITNVHTRLIIILIKLSIINPISKIFYEHVKEILKAFNHHLNDFSSKFKTLTFSSV